MAKLRANGIHYPGQAKIHCVFKIPQHCKCSGAGMDVKRLNRIKVVLAEKGKTNIWLAAQLNKDSATISRWCQNASQPSLKVLSEIAGVLDVDIRELLVSSKE